MNRISKWIFAEPRRARWVIVTGCLAAGFLIGLLIGRLVG